MPSKSKRGDRPPSLPLRMGDPSSVPGDMASAKIQHPQSPPASRPETPTEDAPKEPAMPPTEVQGGGLGAGSLSRAFNDPRPDSGIQVISDAFNEFVFLKDRNTKLSIAHREILDEYRTFRNELEVTKDELAAQKGHLETDVREKGEKLGELGAQNSQLAAQLTETNSTLEEERRKAEAAAAGAAVEIDALKTTLDMKETDLTAIHATLEKVKEKAAAGAASAAEKLAAKQGALEETKAELDKTKGTLEDQIKTASEAAESAAQRIAAQDQALEAKERELKDTASALEAERSNAQTAAASAAEDISAKVSALEEKEKELNDTKLKLLEEKKNAEDAAQSASKETADLTQSLAQQEAAVARLSEDLKAEQDKLAASSTTVSDLEAKLTAIQENLGATRDKLQHLERFRIELKTEPEDAYVSILDKIWTSLLSLVESAFRQDLDEAVLTDSSCWSNLRTSEYLRHARQIPIPQTNTPAAKGMRIAAVLAVLSRALHKYIFRPVYLVEHDDGIVQLLREVEESDPSGEVHFRSTLLRLLPERQRASGVKRVAAVVREVSWLVQHLLSSLQFDAFRSRLEAACRMACTEWMRIQLAKMKIEPYFGPPYDDYDWQVLELPEFQAPPPDTQEGGAPTVDGEPAADGSSQGAEERAGSGGGGADDETETETETAGDDDAVSVTSHDSAATLEPNEILLVVWPSMCAIEEGELASITQGLVITKEQARSAMEEVRSRGGRKANAKRARSMSMARVSTREGEGEGSPTRAFLEPTPATVDNGGLEGNDG